ncbi:hypothetical protein [Sinorhizobium meliloti]|uniref:hypothetical protein n=1 Tax=Rhizobium meliloti TaxID=382 RepID=UPI002380BEBB|nr:hypothetical protein [Sinorhizobium meliloti]MDE3819695.1 hypothetical protein [Sinorhizobium meliloti]
MGKRQFHSQAASLLFALALSWSQSAANAEELAGKVIDSLTKLPMSGVLVSAELSGNQIGKAYTGSDGTFSVAIQLPTTDLTYVTAIISSPDYDSVSIPVPFDDGSALNAPTIPMQLRWISACKTGYERTIIVGHFLPPSTAGNQTDLADRVALSMSSALLKKLQQIHLATDLQPTFWPCSAAKARRPELGASIAKALLADAFVGGDVTHSAANAFEVSTYVSDAYGQLGTFVHAKNTNVDLDSPSGATMADETHVAVLAAVAAGIINKDDCATAMKVLAVAEQMASAVPSYLQRMKEHCIVLLPNRRLLRGPPP